VDDISLTIGTGEFFSLLGPSGCGKTTTLRMIGGFDLPTAGRIELRGRDATLDPPDKRPVNMVFQSYALFPHLDVAGNIAFGLKRRGVDAAEIRRRTGEILEKVRLPGYEKRRTNELSGGQQQRIALARALVNEPNVLLLDEPLGALDLKLRRNLQLELKRIQKDVGITFVYVTHDQEEALTMSDRLAVFNQGRIEQMGTPADLYERPATAFVAGFVGTSNLLRGDVATSLVGSEGVYTVRPEKIRLADRGAAVAGDEVGADGTIRTVVYLGPDTRYIVALDAGSDLVVTQQNLNTSSMEVLAAQGQPVRLVWKRQHVLRVEE
jgi:putative spermidine/putrescine transport system ATP-binding protein